MPPQRLGTHSGVAPCTQKSMGRDKPGKLDRDK